MLFNCFLNLLIVSCAIGININMKSINIVSRKEWNASAPTQKEPKLNNPVPYVIIHHTYIPKACFNFVECVKDMRAMQNYHQNVKMWADIGYNFCIGSDGLVYEGRGWNIVGAHAPHYNNISIGICLIGDWQKQLPPLIQLEITKKFINYGINLNMISKNYELMGHRQVRNTLCPGDALYNEIQTWNHYTNTTPF